MGIVGSVATRPDWLRPYKFFFFSCVCCWCAWANMWVRCEMGVDAYECLCMCSLVLSTLTLRGRCILGVIGLLPWGVFILWWHAQGRGRLLSLCGPRCWCLASSSLECAVPDHLILVLYSAGELAQWPVGVYRMLHPLVCFILWGSLGILFICNLCGLLQGVQV